MNDWQMICCDCREAMKTMADASVDAVVTDPPYELGFMGKSWDRTGIAYQVDVWREVLRVLKPGGHLVAAGGSRTHHRLACAIEDAGFELRDTICHVFGSGFPKSLDVSKAIDDAAGVKREVVSVRKYERKGTTPVTRKATSIYSKGDEGNVGQNSNLVTAPATEAAKCWEGWGTALKPAAEFWTVARKLLEGTVAENILKHGTGGLNVDGCRVNSGLRPSRERSCSESDSIWKTFSEISIGVKDQGRWPPNFVMSHSPDCGDECAPSCPVAEIDRQSGYQEDRSAKVVLEGGESGSRDKGYDLNFGNYPARTGYQTSGGASRFFPCFRYVAKAGRRERDEGLENMPIRSAGEVTNRKDGTAGLKSPRAGAGRTSGGRNTHPTVKPIALMRWLVRLVTPPGGLVLDPFAGSGSTGCAAVAEGFRFHGIELDKESAELACMRVEYWASLEHQMDLFETTFR